MLNTENIETYILRPIPDPQRRGEAAQQLQEALDGIMISASGQGYRVQAFVDTFEQAV